MFYIAYTPCCWSVHIAIDSLIAAADKHIIAENYLEALDLYTKAVNHMEADNIKSASVAYAYMKMAVCYDYFDFNDFSKHYLEKANEIYHQQNDRQGMAYCLSYKGDMLEDDGNNSGAMRLHQNALRLFMEIKDTKGIAMVYDNLASVYENYKQYDSAHFYLQKAFKIYKNTRDSLGLAIVLNNFGDVDYKQGKYVWALYKYSRSLAIALQIKNKEEQRGNYKDISKVNAAIGNYKAAFDYFSAFYKIHRQLKIEKKIEEISVLEVRSIREKSQLEIQALESEKQLMYLRYTIALVLLLLLFVIVLSVYIAYRIRTNKDRQLAALQNERMQTELQIRKEKLLDFTQMLAERGQMVEDLKHRLDETLHKEKIETNARFKAIQQLSNAIILTDEDWFSFKKQFEQVYEGFFAKLNQQYPELSTGDIRLAALIRLKITKEEIANMMGISADSVKKAKSRLKKKISQEDDFKLKDWVETI